MESGSIWATDLHGGRLWLGAGRDARNLEQLRAHGITHILNCADDVPNYHDREPGLAYLRLEIVDFGGDKGSARVFPAAAEFARGALAEGGQGRVLVHCANGSNRSATVCAALFMDVYGARVRVRVCVSPGGPVPRPPSVGGSTPARAAACPVHRETHALSPADLLVAPCPLPTSLALAPAADRSVPAPCGAQ